MGKLFTDSPTIGTGDTKMDQSAPQNTAVGGGSRPTKAKIAIPTSAPDEPHTLGRAPRNWLK